MPLFKTILSKVDLPHIGQSYETYNLDMKSFSDNIETSKQYSDIEMAKDVAAFANSTGGVILVGAIEKIRHGGFLSGYSPISEKKAEEVKNYFSRAVETRCSPGPIIDIAIIPFDQTRAIAVNIWPFPGQPISVRGRFDHALEGKSCDAYIFPLRIGVNTNFIKPEQLPMLMLADVRKNLILLEQIPKGAGENIRIKFIDGDTLKNPNDVFAEIESIDMMSLTVSFLMRKASSRRGQEQAVNVPLDAIRSVWKEQNNIWSIALGHWCLSFENWSLAR